MGSVLLRDEANAADSSSQQVVIDMDAAQRFTQMQLVDQQVCFELAWLPLVQLL